MCVCKGARERERERVQRYCQTKASQGSGACKQLSSTQLVLQKLLPLNQPLTIGLVTHAQDDLRGAVVACNHIGCHKEASGSSSGQAEVQNLQGAIRLYHNVAGLQVLSRHTTQAWFRGGGTRCWFEGGIGQHIQKEKSQTANIYISKFIDSMRYLISMKLILY